MGRLFIRLCFGLITCVALAACSHALSEKIRSSVELDITFKDIVNSPDGFLGKQFIWGGFIVSGRTEDEGTYLEMVQCPVDSYGNILDTDTTEGRFIAFFPGEMLDPAIYSRGRVMTLGGSLTRTIKGSISKRPYTYPLLEVAESRLWKPEFLLYPQQLYLYSTPFPFPRQGPYPAY